MVTDIIKFKAEKAAAKAEPLVSRRRATTTGGALLATLCEAEANDTTATLRFDMTPDDLTAIEAFTFHLQQRIQERLQREQSTKRPGNQPIL